MRRVFKFLIGWLADSKLKQELIDLRADNKRVKGLLRNSEEKNRDRRLALADMQRQLRELQKQFDETEFANEVLAMGAAESLYQEPDDKDAEIILLRERISGIERDHALELDLLTGKHNAETASLRAMLAALQSSVAAAEAMRVPAVKVPEHLLTKIGHCAECGEPKFLNGLVLHKPDCPNSFVPLGVAVVEKS